jgi:hypothetical protein
MTWFIVASCAATAASIALICSGVSPDVLAAAEAVENEGKAADRRASDDAAPEAG